MKHISLKNLGFAALISTAASLSSAEQMEGPNVWQSCLPTFTANSISVPENCGYAVNYYLDTYLTAPFSINDAGEKISSTSQSIDSPLIMNNDTVNKACIVNDKARKKLSMAITKNLIAAGEDRQEVERIVNDSIVEQYPC